MMAERAESICPEGGGVRQQGKTVENGNQEGLACIQLTDANEADYKQMLGEAGEYGSALCPPDREPSFERKGGLKTDTG